MVSAGNTTLAFAKEQTFLGDLVQTDGSPDYWKFGRNPTVTELELDRALENLTEGDQAEFVESIPGNLEGAFGIEAVISSDVHSDVEDLIFNDGGTAFTSGRAASGRVFAGLDYLDGTAERELLGCVPLDYSVSYSQGENTVTYSLSMGYADENLGTSITPSSINSVSDGTSAAFHGVTVTIDGAEVSLPQEAELSISNISTFLRGASHVAEDAVLARPETEFSVDATITGPSRTELAYGGTGATETAARMDSVSGSLSIAVDGQTVSTYELPKLKVANGSWEDVIADDETTTTDSTTFNVVGGITVA